MCSVELDTRPPPARRALRRPKKTDGSCARLARANPVTLDVGDELLFDEGKAVDAASPDDPEVAYLLCRVSAAQAAIAKQEPQLALAWHSQDLTPAPCPGGPSNAHAPAPVAAVKMAPVDEGPTGPVGVPAAPHIDGMDLDEQPPPPDADADGYVAADAEAKAETEVEQAEAMQGLEAAAAGVQQPLHSPLAHTPGRAGQDPEGEAEEGQDAAAGPASALPSAKAKADVAVECADLLAKAAEVLLPQQGTAEGAAPGPKSERLVGPEMRRLWEVDIAGLRACCSDPRTTIGVVGNTGAGKSSLLNALLGEEDILPTNGMRASTGCPIEVSYAPQGTYRRSVEFLTQDEWLPYVERLLEDLTGEDGQLKICTSDRHPDTRSEAGAAQAMLEAVYGRELIRRPGLSLQRLHREHNHVTALLGTVKQIASHDRKQFRKKIGEFVDSHNKSDRPQAWPIVKLLAGGAVLVDLPGVRDANEARGKVTYSAHASLSFLSFLSSIQRVRTVAEEYMKKLDAVWVVADITRAVDDKTAKDLLGSSFRRRMVMDGQLDALTFVCTKADNISVQGTLEELGVSEVCALAGVAPEAFMALDARIDSLRREEARAKKAKKAAGGKVVGALRKCRRLASEAALVHKTALGAFRAAGQQPPGRLAELASRGTLPEKMWGKKKAGAGAKKGGKKAGSDDDDDEEEEEGDDEEAMSEEEDEEAFSSDGTDAESSEGEDAGSDGDYAPSDDEGADSDAAEASCGGEEEEDDEEREDEDGEGEGKRKRRRRGARSGGGRKKPKKSGWGEGVPSKRTAEYRAMGPKDLLGAMSSVVSQLSAAKAEHAALTAQRRTAEQEQRAATGRLVRPQLEMASICARARNAYSRERLQSDFAEGIAEMEDMADDKRLAELPQLPVYCVSARDAQKLERRNKKDGKPACFSKQHVRETADRGRRRAQQALVTAVFQFLDGAGSTLLSERLESSAAAAEAVHSAFDQLLDGLERQLEGLGDSTANTMQKEWLEQGLLPRLTSGSQAAQGKALDSVTKWGTKFRWSTYKAAARRYGVYSGGVAGQIDWNFELVEPVYNAIQVPWDSLFNHRLPGTLAGAEKPSLALFDSFVESLRQRMAALGVGTDQLDALQKQVRREAERQLRTCLQAATARAAEAAKELSHGVLEPAVQAFMRPAYTGAAEERGKGSFMRMRSLMCDHVAERGDAALDRATQLLGAEVRKLLRQADEDLRAALTLLVEGAEARFALLWDQSPSSYDHRYAAAAALHGLVVAAGGLFRRVGLEAEPEPFALPDPPREAAEGGEDEEAGNSAGGEGEEEEEQPLPSRPTRPVVKAEYLEIATGVGPIMAAAQPPRAAEPAAAAVVPAAAVAAKAEAVEGVMEGDVAVTLILRRPGEAVDGKPAAAAVVGEQAGAGAAVA
ncbi:hypothetical protein HYH03_008025 [Edaphochlamys debaryana]|uniref:Uncharacterized protein n=1 Tax=Edaphochlamys debaryana TaxID=47281 RepID=A0A835Y467_9CHLO|nr:hypothetical protein HYH03_008025 [Edaphochlamys debaryana]|eukprot:KAG2493806.1 hypothetical protein HYH03_008025 [Edaphochlamys debaryana]